MNLCLCRLTVGADNCLFHLTYIDHLEGVVVSSPWKHTDATPLEREIHTSFQLAAQRIKKLFDNARKVKVRVILIGLKVQLWSRSLFKVIIHNLMILGQRCSPCVL